MNKIINICIIILLAYNCNNLIQDDFELDTQWRAEDINPNSSSYGEEIGPSDYEEKISLYYFPKSPT